MKFKFVKDNENINVFILDDEKSLEFNYITMINILYNKKSIELSEFQGEFSNDERSNIEQLVEEIVKAVKETESTTESEAAAAG